MKLEFCSISKNYGKVQALKDVQFTLENGICGILGPNGAGKSTLVKILCGLLTADQGEILFNGQKIKRDFCKKIGVMPQQQELYPYFGVEEFLYYMAALKGLKKKEIQDQIERLLEIVRLKEVRKRRISQLSGGMKQRLLIAQALLGNPEILIFDEPTAGLDPNQRIEIRNFFATLAQDHIVLITTHVVQDVESIAQKLLFLDHGQIIKQGNPSELVEELMGKVKEVEINKDHPLDNIHHASIITRRQDKLVLRLVTEESFEHEQLVYPTIEDAYLWYIGEPS